MAQLILLSVQVGLIVIPVLAARAERPMLALRRAVLFTLLFNVLYAFATLVVYPRLALQ